MKTEEMKTLSEHLIDALTKEDLRTREAARSLNLNPIYISMAKNPKCWDSISKEAWYRLTQWHNSRGRITEYKIPEDEEILEIFREQPAPPAKQEKQDLPGKTERKEPATRKPERNDAKVLMKKGEEWEALAEAFSPPEPAEAHLRVCLDLEVNLSVRVQKVTTD